MLSIADFKGWRQYLTVCICTLSVATISISFTWLEPLTEWLVSNESEFKVTKMDTGWLVSSVEIGATIFCVPAGIIADRWGRKWTLYSIGPITIFTWILVLTTRSVPVLFIIRILQGLTVAVIFSVCPMYIAEVSEPKVRGLLSGQFETMYAFGALYAFSTGPFLSYQNYAYVCAILPLLFTLTFPFMPETPFFLQMSGREEDAKITLSWLRGTKSVDDEYKKIRTAVDEDMNNKANWKDLIATKKDRKILFNVLLACFTRYISGSTLIHSYATSLFVQASPGHADEYTLTIIMGVLLVLSAILGSFLADIVGRRPLLIGTTFAMSFLHLISGIYFFMAHKTDIDVSEYTWLMYFGVIGSSMLINVGLGSLLQTVQGELFPSHTRAMGGAASAVMAGIASFISLSQYQIINDSFGVYMNFLIFFFYGATNSAIMYFTMPETNGKQLGETHDETSKNKMEKTVHNTPL